MEGDSIGTPVVMLGHSKDFWNDRNLGTFLKFVKTECADTVRFSTLAECTRRVLEKHARRAPKPDVPCRGVVTRRGPDGR